MENTNAAATHDFHPQGSFAKKFLPDLSNLNRIFVIVLIAAAVLGIGTGYSMSGKGTNGALGKLPGQSPKAAIQDTQTFRDFAEGTLRAKPAPKNGADYSEGSYMLVRDGADPVALTSSVVDLAQYEGKKVKVYGETQKALKAGWLMDVGRVEEVK